MGDCFVKDIEGVNDEKILKYVYLLKIKDLVKVIGFLDENLFFLKVVGLLYLIFYNFYVYYNYGVNVYVRCIVRYSVFEVCGIELD